VSNKAVGWAWDQCTDRPIDKMILVALADCAARDGYSYPSHAELAEMAQCSPDSVQRALRRLIARGLIRQEARWRDNGGRTSNGYTVLYLPELRAESAPDPACPSPDGEGDPLPQPAASPLPQPAASPLPQNAAPPTATVRHPLPQLCGMHNEPPLNPHFNTPPLPPEPGERVCVASDPILEELEADGVARHVVSAFIRPLWGAKRLPGGVEPLAFLRDIRAVLADVEPEVLERAVAIVRRERSIWPSAAQCHAIVTRAASEVPLRQFATDSAAGRAWLAHYRATGRAFWARTCEERGFVAERSAVPPIDGRSP
jgi:hypothetical protein